MQYIWNIWQAHVFDYINLLTFGLSVFFMFLFLKLIMVFHQKPLYISYNSTRLYSKYLF